MKMEDTADHMQDFPRYTEEEIRALTLGVYQVKLAKSYAQEHFNEDGTYEILIDTEDDGLLAAKIQSRHTSAKKYMCWIRYEDGVVNSCYCQCKTGARVVGTCAHITSIIWYLAFARHSGWKADGTRRWIECVIDAAVIPETVDESESDSSVIEE